MLNIDIPDNKIEDLFTPFIKKRVNYVSPRFQLTKFKLFSHWSFRRYIYLLNKLILGNKRTTENTRLGYEKKWDSFNYDFYTPECSRSQLMEWKNNIYYANPYVKGRIQLLYFNHLIEKLNPENILEVGSGKGSMLVPLSRRFPNKKFTGLELTRAGIESARQLNNETHFREEFKMFLPFSIHNKTDNLKFVQASAEHIPFKSNTYDMVYTNQALEQMEHIRHDVLYEISRITRRHAVFFEPFKNWNACGLRRNRVLASEYFSGEIEDLKDYGLIPIYQSDNMPQKFIMHTGIVVAEKSV